VRLQQPTRLMTNDVRIWLLQTRFFRPYRKEEFDVRVDPAGGVAVTHELERTAPARGSNARRRKPPLNLPARHLAT